MLSFLKGMRLRLGRAAGMCPELNDDPYVVVHNTETGEDVPLSRASFPLLPGTEDYETHGLSGFTSPTTEEAEKRGANLPETIARVAETVTVTVAETVAIVQETVSDIANETPSYADVVEEEPKEDVGLYFGGSSGSPSPSNDIDHEDVLLPDSDRF
jgi:hypothetical protein